jgi:hypothetical protein
MSDSNTASFDLLLGEISDWYRSRWFVDTKKIKPRLKLLTDLVATDPAHQADYLARFIQLADELKSLKLQADIRRNLDVLHFCMRHFQWFEITEKLKHEHRLIPEPDTRLEVEVIIKAVLDPHWQGGEFEFFGTYDVWSD